MSGGHFDYKQSYIRRIVEDIELYLNGITLDDGDIKSYLAILAYNIARWDSVRDKEEYDYVKEHHHGKPNNLGFSEETIKEFKKGVEYLKKAYVYAERIDYLFSGDDGEEEFHKRLKEDLAKLE